MINIIINNVDKTSFIDWQSVTKEEVLTKQPDNLSFRIKNYGTKTYRPVLGDEVVMWGENYNIWGEEVYPWLMEYPWASPIFGGFIVETKEVINGMAKEFEVICKDYTQILDRKLVSKTYEAMDAEDIIEDLIETYALGITTDNVDAPVLIDKVVFNYLPISKCLQKLADALGNYDWYIDSEKDIHFFENTSIPSPFNLTDLSAEYIWNSLEIKEKTHQIKNLITVRGGEYQSTTLSTKFHDGDGTKAVFNTDFKFGELPVVKVGGVSKTVGLDSLNDDTDFQVMWNYQQKYIRFTSGNIPGSGTRNIEIIGYPLLPLIVQRVNTASVLAYGIYEFLIFDKTIKTTDAAIQRGDAELLKYANPQNDASFITHSLGLRAGQTINVQSDIRDIDEDFLIESITTTLRTPTEAQFLIRLATATSVGVNDILRKLLIDNVADGIEITPGEIVQRFESFAETFAVTDTLGTPSVDSPPYTYGAGSSNPLVWGFGTWHS